MDFTTESIDRLFNEGRLVRIGMGSRRVCFAVPGTEYCIKCYKNDEEIKEGRYPGSGALKPLSKSVVDEIAKARFSEKRNTSCQEYRYWKDLERRVPAEIFSVFPDSVRCVFSQVRGWCLVETLVKNADGSRPDSLFDFCRNHGPEVKNSLLSAVAALRDRFVEHAVKFYDPQNLIVQIDAQGDFRLRIVDFEPASRMFIPIDDWFKFIVRIKTARRINRYLRNFFGWPSE